MEKKFLELVMGVLVIISALIIGAGETLLVSNDVMAKDQLTVVIDPGHGGMDPGKVAVTGKLEKDINLQIAMKLKKFLEAEDVKVIMIRETDKGLYSESSSNKKVQDIKKRCEIINNSGADLAVSIHQNSYHEEYVHGAQVFYHSKSEEGKKVAELIQKQIAVTLDPENHREAKANSSYYLLKNTKIPIVIVECGFLSNWKEAAVLEDPYYQEKAAWAIHLSILKYLNQR